MFCHTKPLAAVYLEGTSQKCGHPRAAGEGAGGKGFADAAHELAKLCFLCLTVVIFHRIFNHIVITKHQDFFFFNQSLLYTGCLATAVQNCLCRPALRNVRS